MSSDTALTHTSQWPVNTTSRKLSCSPYKSVELPLASYTSSLVLRFPPPKAKFMTSQLEIQILSAFDPFTEVDINTVVAPGSVTGSKGAVHIRVQQRNGRKCLTTVQGINKSFSYNKILKDLKKEFCCNGNVVDDLELGHVIQLQGDQRKNVAHFLVQAGVAKREYIKIHGF